MTSATPHSACPHVATRTVAIAGIVTAAAMVATPLLPQGGRGRRALASVVVGGLFTTTFATTGRRWGIRRALAAAATIVTTTAAVERLGTATGRPFGGYHYDGALRPRIGGVPVIVPLAWFAMAAPSREAAHAALGTRSNPLARGLLGAAALTAWDLFLDPQMVGEGYWRWHRAGRYRGIPATNFVGWFVTGLGVMVILERLLPAEPEAEAALVGEYGFVAVMETVGFARYFRDPLVAAVGGAAMLPIAVAAMLRSTGASA